MKARHDYRFTNGAIRRRDDNPVLFVPPGMEPDQVAPPPPQTQTAQVLRIPKVVVKKSKYQRG